ncbi:MAG: pyruvate formate lyase family protein [Lachnospiraceae bacterium]
MNSIAEMFYDIDEPYAAGLFEDEDRSDFYRMSKALRRFYEARQINTYKGGHLYPSGLDVRGDFAVQPDCSKTFNPAFGGKGTLKGFYEPLKAKNAEAAEIMLRYREEHNFTVTPSSDCITISGYTHSIPYFERILKEGFESYKERINKIEDTDMKDGLLEVLAGLKNYHGRCLAYLREVNADADLIAALEKVPFHPADTIYEAIVGWNFILYLDGLDNIGWLDEGLTPWYRGENVVPYLREMFMNVVENDGWSGAIGPHYNDLTRQCLQAVKGLFRPMLELRVTKDMPEDLWELAIETVYSGGGQPAFYNEEVIQNMLTRMAPDLPDDDRMRYAGAGCTEPNLAGLSNVGGIDGNINLAMVLEQFLNSDVFAGCRDFDEFYEKFSAEVCRQTRLLISDVTRNHEHRVKHLPHPMRSLLIDDCIDRGLDYNNGGARFNAALTAESGMINVIDSMSAIRTLIYEKKQYTPEEFVRNLKAEDDNFFRELRRCPHYGSDEKEVNELADRFSRMFYSNFTDVKCVRGNGAWLPSSHQFNRYGKEGLKVGPTPDGRRAKEALCDSVAPIGGKAVKGPTAALLSALNLNQNMITGIPVYNLTLHKKYPKPILSGLIKGYFQAGGVQIQITMVSKEELEDALVHPEKHEDLVVRVGGYSEYFNRLTPELKQAVYKRTIFEME